MYILFDGLVHNTGQYFYELCCEMYFSEPCRGKKKCEQQVKCWPVLRANPSNNGFIIYDWFSFAFFVVVGIFLRHHEKQFESQSVMMISSRTLPPPPKKKMTTFQLIFI